uniref:Nucleoprotein n=2 Tax=Infectious bronchitis virus TaxID=11120 RepID=NCAP_IBVV1|nr:RecName: Full=Nucleoprotein; AltName: Full=Nucleocapsid protein; Short=NC; Short=Protein N [Avian infectious bronchitis virus (strain V18/91)]AAB48162.1 nucleocapsid protein [Infectious bronchitis virus]ABF61578.1 nucleocapsid [Infectious bronchitis virus]QKG30353.1 Nucleocapsid protein [Infectious bronchitis virus]
MSAGKLKFDSPAPILKLSKNTGSTPPKVGGTGQASWFQSLKEKKRTGTPPTFEGSGVPDNSNVKPQFQHGYWKRQHRYKPGKGGRKPVADAWYFYYTGTGPFGDLKWGDSNDDVVWVKAKGADTSKIGNYGVRDPDKFDQAPLRFTEGGPDNNYRWDFIALNRGRSRNSSAVTSRENSRPGSRDSSRGRQRSRVDDDLIDRAAKIIMQQQKNGSRISKQKANEMAERKYHKRAIAPGKRIDEVFGQRRKGQAPNFGDDKMIEEGVKDGRLTAMLNLVPTPHACLLGSMVTAKLQPDGLHVRFSFETVVKREDPQFANYSKICDECVDGVGTRPKDDPTPRSRAASKDRNSAPATPKQQRAKKVHKKKEEESSLTEEEEEVNKQLEYDDDVTDIPNKIDWGEGAFDDINI